ncbi:MAG: AMP-binding protein [Myxococcota bacterium]|nr:AMP-binding protein [Myxococcota bacterium]
MSDLALHRAYHWEKTRPSDIWFTQPMGNGVVRELSFAEAMDEARRMATHLISLDLPPKSQIALFSKNSAWWILADLAIWMAGHVSVPLYPTLAADTIGQILEHSESKLIFIGKLDDYESMAPGIPDDLPAITLPLSPTTPHPTWANIIGETEPLQESPLRDPDEMATIVYTSGSTGVPKGVMLGFGSMASCVAEVQNVISIGKGDRMLSYLPLAHVLERFLVETATLIYGFHVFFAESLDTFVDDLKRARPTFFASVPRLWQKFQLGVFQKMPPKKLNLLLKIPILNKVIAKKVLGGLGLDAVRYAISGSAPIPAALIDWYRALGLELLEAYGMSENFCYSHCTRPGDVKVGFVGTAQDGVECRLSDAGEILVKSPGSMLGYFKAEQLTQDAFTEDGFLKTGDRGEIDSGGRLRITGRVKELFKTSKGKYVAPAPIENKLLLSNHVEMACVSGSGQPAPFGMVVLSEEARAASADSARRAEIGTALDAHRAEINTKLDHHEQLMFLTVIGDAWTIENGKLTPTMKLKRNAIEDEYAGLVDGWYDEGQKVLWHG